MDGLTREIAEGSKTDKIVKAFESALAGESGPERCIKLLRPDSSTDSASGLTFSAMIRDAERDCIPGDNIERRVLRPEALCQTAVLISMCSKRTFEAAREQLVRQIVTHYHHHHHHHHHQSKKNIGNHQQQSNKDQGDAEYWQERTEFHLDRCKSRAKRLRNSDPNRIEADMKARKEMSEEVAKGG